MYEPLGQCMNGALPVALLYSRRILAPSRTQSVVLLFSSRMHWLTPVPILRLCLAPFAQHMHQPALHYFSVNKMPCGGKKGGNEARSPYPCPVTQYPTFQPLLLTLLAAFIRREMRSFVKPCSLSSSALKKSSVTANCKSFLDFTPAL